MPWYVVQTKFKEEDRAVENLKAQRFRVYCPMLKVRSKKGERTIPMFSGYVFVQFSMKRREWRKIASTRGCKRLLGIDAEKPCKVPSSVIKEMMRQEETLGEVIEIKKVFKAGDRLQLLGGPLEGHIGVWLKTSSGRVQMLLHLLGGEHKVYSNITNVELAQESLR